VEAAERLSADGAVTTPLDEPALATALARAFADGFQSVAVAFLHADLNPAHEQAAGRLARAAGFAHVSLSHEVSPLPRLVLRARTTVVDAYLTPVLRAYVERLSAAVQGAPLWFMTSAGALVRAEAFRGRDAVLSGPAGGVVGVGEVARAAGEAAVLGFDMGGTSTDVSRWAGRLDRRETSVAAGFTVRAPALDVETVAAGGGSILRFDGLRARVGPESAGADPGPAAYGRGGPATVTDANLVLGRLAPERFPALFGPAGDQPLDAAAARAALTALADAMGAASPEAAAAGFLAVAVEQTAQAVRKISVERGFDPRTHALVAFGGAAGQVACDVAEALGCDTVLCPEQASVLSAWGIGQATVSALRQAGLETPLDEHGLACADALSLGLAAEAAAALHAQGEAPGAPRTTLRLRYDGSDTSLSVPAAALELVRAAFEHEHRKLFGFTDPGRPLLIASVEVGCVAAHSDTPAGPAGPFEAQSEAGERDLLAERIRSVLDESPTGLAKAKATLTRVSPWLAAVAAEHSVDLAGYRHTLDGSAVRHIRNRHGDALKERAIGQLAVRDADLLRLPQVLDDPDAVVFGLVNPRGQQQLVMLRTFDDGTSLVVEEVRLGAKSLALVSMRRYPGAIDAHRLTATLDPNARSAPRGGLKIVMAPSRVTCGGASIVDLSRPGSPSLDGPVLLIRGDTQIHVAPGWRATRETGGLVRLSRTAAVCRAAAPDLSRADPVTLELFNRRFMGVAEAMGAALERTAHSVNIKERLDFSCALFDADGGLVANAPHMPVHLGSMGASVRAITDRHPELNPGDAFALNNPYAGGTHLPDVTVVMPVFLGRSEQPAFHVAARGHHADVGGVQPGSMPPFSRTLAEEGVLLDALPVMRGGVLLEADVRAAFAAGPHPSRDVGRNLADLKAQVAACQAGAAAVSAMIAEHGQATVEAYMRFVQANAEACVRRAVSRLTDGAARVPVDGGGEIVVRVTVDALAGEATLDFTGTSDVLPSNFNAPSAVVDAAALYVFRTLVDDDIPLNAGCLAPLKIILPRPSMLAPEPPAAVVAGNVETSQHLVDALYAATGTLANSAGSMSNFTFGDLTRQYYETISGGAGAAADADGASAVQTHMTNSRLTDPEILERRFPVRLERFAVRRGSGGLGEHQGGDGVTRRVRFLAAMESALLSTRREHAPQGLAGGGPALPGRQRLIAADGRVTDLPGCFSVAVQPGDAIEIETPGGGGFGPPPR
jgi:5-oxoprolinase (ATP-hydrolysing)